VTVPKAAEAPMEAPHPSGGGGGSSASGSGTGNNTPTKVMGPKSLKELLPAFSPPAINQFPNFYDPGAYAPVAGSSNLPAGFTGRTVPDMGGQSRVASILGVPWSASTLDLQPGKNGYGMPEGGSLKN